MLNLNKNAHSGRLYQIWTGIPVIQEQYNTNSTSTILQAQDSFSVKR